MVMKNPLAKKEKKIMYIISEKEQESIDLGNNLKI